MGIDPAISEEGDLEIQVAGGGPRGSFSRRGLGVLIAAGRLQGVFSPLVITAPAAGSGGRGHLVTRRRSRR
jgi:hypothetical protein